MRPFSLRGYFFALFSVLTNVMLGLSPIFWGILIDAVGSLGNPQRWLEWNRFTVFFAAVAIALLGTLYYVRRLEEPRPAEMTAS